MKLSRETGIFVVGFYAIEPRLTWRELEARYPEVVLQHVPQSEVSPRTYLLTSFEFQGHQLQVQLTFYGPYLSIVNISRVENERADEADFWTRQLVHWTKVAHIWLQSQLGEPHRTMAGELFDEEEYLTPEDVRVLRSWEYIFDWGCAGYYFDSIQQPGDIFIHPDYHHQIRNWDELLAVYASPLPLQTTKISEEIILAIAAAVDEIRNHFDYLQLRPRPLVNGIKFELKRRSHWDVRNWVSIDVNLNREQGKYCVSRTDKVSKAYMSDVRELVDRLREYIAECPL